MSLRYVEFPPKDQPLRQDVGLLGELVGEVIREQGGDELFHRVERARHAAIARREGAPDGHRRLRETLGGLGPEVAAEIVRAFSTYFQLVNLAERVHRIRRGRDHMRDETEPQPGSLAATVRTLRSLGIEQDRALRLFAESRVEPVFTAHPTEATRRIILEKQERVALELISRLDPSRTPHEERVSLARIRQEVTAAWQTEESPGLRPTVGDERRHVLYYVSNVLYRVLPSLHERLDDALLRELGVRTPTSAPTLLRVGSWVGGDMDGNPNVDAATIRSTLERHRDRVLARYAEDVSALARQLSQSASRVAWSDAVDALVEQYSDLFPDVRESVPDRQASMGYRVLLELVRARLRATGAGTDGAYPGPDVLLSDLGEIARSLEAHRGTHAGLFGVRRLIRRVRAFGFHLATLDVRQDARELREVMSELLDDPTWPAKDPARRAERLRRLLESPDLPAGGPGGPRAARTLEVFRAMGDGRTTFGPDAIGPFIVSMAGGADDVLTVLWLAAVAGLGPPDQLPLDVVPLFETVPELEGAEGILEELFADPRVAPHLEQRGGRLTVMVGYSDSNKDGGIASARWAIQRALGGMARAAARHGVTLTVFHGRGGTVSRGGGSVHRAVGAMPPGAIGGRLRLTEQGEVIDAKYGLPQIALRTLERMLGAMVLRDAEDDGRRTPPAWEALADTMAGAARATYRELVYDDPRFEPYFRTGTPIDVIERMPIGSRPASRRSGAGLEDLRAIPWVFSWTQCRAMLPGWYGLGSGLEAAREKHGAETLREVAEGWPFMDALLADVEMVLAKADLEIAEQYADLAPEGARPVFGAIRREFDRTVEAVLDLRGGAALLGSDPTLQRSIRLRNPYVDPMSVLQVDLLGRWRAEGRPDGPLFGALLATVNGIARGLQNTG